MQEFIHEFDTNELSMLRDLHAKEQEIALSIPKTQEKKIHIDRKTRDKLQKEKNKEPDVIDHKKKVKALPFQYGHYHYKTCKNDTPSNYKLQNCNCQDIIKKHNQTLQKLSQIIK